MGRIGDIRKSVNNKNIVKKPQTSCYKGGETKQ